MMPNGPAVGAQRGIGEESVKLTTEDQQATGSPLIPMPKVVGSVRD